MNFFSLTDLTQPLFHTAMSKISIFFSGDLMHEEEILKWVLDLHESTPDVIESVDRKTLQVLINGVEHLAVYFCKALISLTRSFSLPPLSVILTDLSLC